MVVARKSSDFGPVFVKCQPPFLDYTDLYAAKRVLRARERRNCVIIGLNIARAYRTQCCKPFQTFQVLEMDAGANVLNVPNIGIREIQYGDT